MRNVEIHALVLVVSMQFALLSIILQFALAQNKIQAIRLPTVTPNLLHVRIL
jgi:hypothetical protein